MTKIQFLTSTKRKTLYSFNPRADEIVAKAVGEEAYYEYRELWQKTSRVEMELDFPLQVDIELSSGCNLDCPMCPSALREMESKIVLMDFDVYKKIIDDAMAHGAKAINLNYVNEPLLRKDIARFISYARERGALDVMFNTNGIPLTKALSRQLVASGLTKLSVSVDAFSKEVYDKIRIGGSFERLIRNIFDFLGVREGLRSELPLLKLTFLVSKLNYHELDDFLAFWEDKADLVSLQNMSNPFEGEEQVSLNETMALPDRQTAIDTGYKCPHPFQRMTVRYDGTVLPCCHFFGAKLVIGNVEEQPIHNIYHTPFAKEIRRVHRVGEHKKIPVCHNCILNTPTQTFK